MLTPDEQVQRDMTLAVTCPTCLSTPDHPCVTMRGTTMVGMHSARYRASGL